VSTRPPVRFGLFIGQTGRSWTQVLEEFQLAEALGFDHGWLVDHLMPTDGPEDVSILEAWTLLGALAARTSRIHLGVLVTNNLFRNPALLAKQAVTVDRVSGGRLILGLGTGWFEREHRAYGFSFPPAGERVDRLEEAVQVLRALFTGRRPSLEGRFYGLDDAPCEPRPVRASGIPILIAAHRPRMLRLAARHADIWDTFPEIRGAATEGVPADLPAQAARFEAEARAAGREPVAIRRSTWAPADTAASVATYADFVRRHRALGFTDLTIGLPGPAHRSVLEEISVRILPAQRGGTDDQP
jgi:alkanesulfonate monooxygenase SsuD/methylene tetrahydromethanopterin reductase-like flavin-dependent oxidoreductase (luciferase family)